MLDPIERERIESAIKAALQDRGVNISEAGRILGKGKAWVSSVLQRVRDGQPFTVETFRIMRVEFPTLEGHLNSAGWSSFGSTRARPVLATRSTEHLRLQRNNLMQRREQLDQEIRELTAQIAELEGMARGEM